MVRALLTCLPLVGFGGPMARGQEMACELAAPGLDLGTPGRLEEAPRPGAVEVEDRDLLIPIYTDLVRRAGEAGGAGATEGVHLAVRAASLELEPEPGTDVSRQPLRLGGIDHLESEDRIWAVSFASASRFVPGPPDGEEIELVDPLGGAAFERTLSLIEPPGAGAAADSALAGMLAAGPMSGSVTCTLVAVLGVAWLAHRRSAGESGAEGDRVPGGEW